MRCLLLALLICCGCCSLLAPTADAAIALRALSRSSQAGVMTAVRKQLAQLSTSMPSGVVCSSCLMTRTRSRSKVVQGSVARSQLAAVARGRGLPATVVSRLQALAFSRSVVFHTFSFVVNSLVRRGHYETYVGAGRRLGNSNTVEFGVVHSVVTAQMVAKTTPVRRRKCKRRFFIKRCRSWTQRVPRGLTAQELRRVESAMRHLAVAAGKKKVSAVSRIRRSVVEDEALPETVDLLE